MTRSKQIVALLVSLAALVAFAPTASAAREDGRSRVARANKPEAMVVTPARMRVAAFAPARMRVAAFAPTRMRVAAFAPARVSARKLAPARKGTCPKCGNNVF